MGIKIWFSLLVAVCYGYGFAHASLFTVKNNCPYTVWPATLTSSGPPIVTGFGLSPQQSKTLDIPDHWSGRIWPRFQCFISRGRFLCRSGDCGSGRLECAGRGGAPPATLVEFTLNGADGKDFYDVSLVDGFNLPVSVTSDRACSGTGCPVDINGRCPNELAIKDRAGGVIGCKSACLAFNKPEFCCSPPFDTPDKCSPSDYAKYFKGLCPQAYSYAFDDKSSTFTCPTGGNYAITFCP